MLFSPSKLRRPVDTKFHLASVVSDAHCAGTSAIELFRDNKTEIPKSGRAVFIHNYQQVEAFFWLGYVITVMFELSSFLKAVVDGC